MNTLINLVPVERRKGFPTDLKELMVKARFIVNQMPYHHHYDSALSFLKRYEQGPSN